MTWTIDARLPIRFGELADRQPDDALLLEGDEAPAPEGAAVARFRVDPSLHAAGCACCLPRSPISLALTGLFQRRAKGGETAFFRRVLAVASPEARPQVEASVRSDPLVNGRFRMEG